MPRSVRNANRILNCVPSRDTERDWEYTHALQAESLTGAPVRAVMAPPPGDCDLRENWWDIGDQGMTGSCVGWASADSVLRWTLVKAGKIQNTDHLSVRYIWMAAKETDTFVTRPTSFIDPEGTSLKAALDIARKYGLVLDALVPFRGGLSDKDEQTFYAIAAQLKIAAYYNLRSDLAAWRSWIATHGPILTRLDVDATWDNVDKSGHLDVYQPKTTRGGHAVALVGFTADRFIVRNSWGTSWGDGGYAYASNDYAGAAFTESYGVTL